MQKNGQRNNRIDIVTPIKSHIVTGVVCLAVGVALAIGIRSCTSIPQPTDPIVIHDTISVTDTLRIAGKTKTLYVRDTILVCANNAPTDTTKIDTLVYAQKEYRDTFTTDSSRTELAVRFSGYNAKIDSIGLTQEWTIQPRVVEKKNGWGWCVMPSVQVGYGVAFGSPIIAAPYIGVGVSVGWGYHW